MYVICMYVCVCVCVSPNVTFPSTTLHLYLLVKLYNISIYNIVGHQFFVVSSPESMYRR